MAEKIIAYLKQEADKEVVKRNKEINSYFRKCYYKHNLRRR